MLPDAAEEARVKLAPDCVMDILVPATIVETAGSPEPLLPINCKLPDGSNSAAAPVLESVTTPVVADAVNGLMFVGICPLG